MFNLHQLKLGPRLWLGFGLVLLLTAVIALVGWLRLSSTVDDIDANAQVQSRAMAALKWEGLTLLNVNRTLAIAESGGIKDVKDHFSPLIKETSAQISAIQKELEASLDSEQEKALFADIAAKRKVYVTARDSIFSLLELEDPGAKEALNSQLLPAATRYITAINDYQRMQRQIADDDNAATHAHVRSAKMSLLVLALVSLALGSWFAWVMARSVTVPLRQVVAATHVIARGDLSHRVEMGGRDELSELCHSLEEMQVALRGIVGDVRHSTDSIKVASDEVAMGSQDLSSRTEQAASSLQETASTMEQISGTIRNTADAARTANQLAAGAAEAASHGGEVVSQVVATMDDITQSSRRIADIISVIDGIAFQTNILALNAAVEAARAGEQGRGFAVVAGEVRALAQRAAGAAKEIKVLINASTERVDAGASLVSDAGASMNSIVESVRRVADIIGEITSASTEQSEGISQVNTAVTQLDSMTQQNAALVEQSAAAAESLKDQASRLANVVSVFRLP
ncbi:MAG: HAMP domain-containing protein [Aquabacterium sp.]|uniref:methyl-accepting chemotaxis protein n=1 Tax=Aquabacterium sp. TaxID=1872578 RepID=UPI0025C4114F|nr:methyl-accepting chemotaxis protein [Aquabacterium sp.]MBI5925935.1 HAMP domain-containing protein [Aquabacterium sp.]